METLIYCLYAFVRCGCEAFPAPPAGLVLREFLYPITQFLDENFQPCGADYASYFTLPDGLTPPPKSMLIGRYPYTPKDSNSGYLHSNGQTVPVPDGQYEESTLFQRNWSDPSCFGFASTSMATPATPVALLQPTVDSNLNMSSNATRVPSTDENDKVSPTPPMNEKPTNVTTAPPSENGKGDDSSIATELVEDKAKILRGEDGYYYQPAKKRRPIQATNFLINLEAIKHLHKSDGQEERFILFHVCIPNHGSFVMEVSTRELDNILPAILTEHPETVIFKQNPIGSFTILFQVLVRERMLSLQHLHEIQYSGWGKDQESRWFYSSDESLAPNKKYRFNCGFSFGRGQLSRRPEMIVTTGWSVLKLARAFEKIAVPVLFALLGLMYKLFDAASYPPRSLLFIEGPTGSLKTAVASLLFNFSAVPEKNIPANFRDTPASMELKFVDYKDRVLLVDDFAPAADTASQRAMARSLEQLVRFFGDGVPRARATPTMDKVKELRPCGLIAVTGEDSAGSQSSQLRCIFVHVDSNTFDKEVLHRFQQAPYLWTEFLRLFVDRLAPEAHRIIKSIKELVPKYRAEATQQLSEKRILNAYACLATTADIVVKVMPEGLFPEARTAFHEAALRVCQDSEIQARTADPVRLFCQTLVEALQQNRIHITNRSEFSFNPESFLGFEADGLWYLWPHEAYTLVRKSFADIGKIFPKSEAALWSDLSSRGVLIPKIINTKQGTRKEYGTKIGFGGRPRMLKIDPDRLRAIADDKVG